MLYFSPPWECYILGTGPMPEKMIIAEREFESIIIQVALPDYEGSNEQIQSKLETILMQ